jgi:anti-sigma regulatory factor (Ser/Thr protein kinase)
MNFERRIDELPRLFAFTAETFAAHPCDPSVAMAVDFALEELFTNAVKYGGGRAPLEVTLTPLPGGFELTIEDPDADDFDPTASPDADVSAPLALRQPGGLGLHLIRRMVDSIEYQYVTERRLSRVRVRKTNKKEAEGC